MSLQVPCFLCRALSIILSLLTTAAALLGQPILNGISALPDGRSVIFWSTGDGSLQAGSAVYILGPDGLRRITPLEFAVEATTAQNRPSAVTALPDGTRVAVSNPDGIVVFDMSARETRAIPAPGLADQVHVTPDGHTILFSVPPFTGHYWFPFMYSVPVDGGQLVRLARGALDGRHPVADDGTIVFTSPGPNDEVITTGAQRNVYTMSADGTGIAQLTQFTGSTPWKASISRDGRRILFTSTIPTSSSISTTTVWVMRADGKGRRSLPIDNRLEVVAFSADGSLVAWSLNGQAHVLNVDTGDDRVVAQFAESDIAEMDFTPDHSQLYLLLGRPNGPNRPFGGSIWSIDLASGTAQPVYTPRAISTVNSNFLTPGGFVTIYGSNLIPFDGRIVPSTFPLPQTLGGISLSIDGRPAPLLAVTPWQVNAQIPMETPPGPVSLTMRFDDGTVAPSATARVVATSPEMFHTPGGCAFHAGTRIAADQSHPASPGEILEMYGIGLGVTNPIVPAGELAPVSPLAVLANDFGAFVGNGTGFSQTADVLWAGLSPGNLGLYQVNLQIPRQTPAGSAQISWWTQASGFTGTCFVTIGN